MATELGVTPRLNGWKCKEVGAMQGVRKLTCESERYKGRNITVFEVKTGPYRSPTGKLDNWRLVVYSEVDGKNVYASPTLMGGKYIDKDYNQDYFNEAIQKAKEYIDPEFKRA